MSTSSYPQLEVVVVTGAGSNATRACFTKFSQSPFSWWHRGTTSFSHHPAARFYLAVTDSPLDCPPKTSNVMAVGMWGPLTVLEGQRVWLHQADCVDCASLTAAPYQSDARYSGTTIHVEKTYKNILTLVRNPLSHVQPELNESKCRTYLVGNAPCNEQENICERDRSRVSPKAKSISQTDLREECDQLKLVSESAAQIRLNPSNSTLIICKDNLNVAKDSEWISRLIEVDLRLKADSNQYRMEERMKHALTGTKYDAPYSLHQDMKPSHNSHSSFNTPRPIEGLNQANGGEGTATETAYAWQKLVNVNKSVDRGNDNLSVKRPELDLNEVDHDVGLTSFEVLCGEWSKI
ncbi:hypothetical protein C8R45DRAFT_947468 [Mycena sanguinolenta]|nr:hypothetical protein C8R45DRAFT_947468 [Mycena sanguinolenta]